jgi:muramoyltetrapeptide carboxypeptidase
VGTPEAPDFRDAIVVLEDEKEAPYRLDRFLRHLRRAGALAEARGVVLGEFPECEPTAPDTTTAQQVLEEFFADFPGPVVWGFPVGHTARPSLTIPLGTWARLDGGGRRLELLEPAVD